MSIKKIFNQKGLTLIETIVSIAVFSVLAMIVFQVYALIIKEIGTYRDQAIVSSLADQYIEIVRNLPYSAIGVVGNQALCERYLDGGDPCTLPDLANPATGDYNGVIYNIYYAISYVDDPTDGSAILGTDADPNDYKQIKLYVANMGTGKTEDFLTIVAPENTETLGDRGGLPIKVIDAYGQPVEGATIHIVNNDLDPVVDITRTTGADGFLFEVLLPSVNGYHITVTKNGYSTDYTSPISAENLNPAKPDATIIGGEIAPWLSFSIDYLSQLNIYTLDQECHVMQNIGFEIIGTKLIGTSPSIYKFDKTYYSNSLGKITPESNVCVAGRCLEWDDYTPGIIGDDYMVYGSSPVQQTNILPATDQDFTFILGPKTTNSMLVIVKDSSSGDPIEGVNIELAGPSTGSAITGGSVWSQIAWEGALDSSNVSMLGVPYALRLDKLGDDYMESGWLESEIFDTASSTTAYTILNWQPTSQNASTTLEFQIAASNCSNGATDYPDCVTDPDSWVFTGPNGTTGDYYETPGNTINPADNYKRYVRYKVFLSTEDSAVTPALTRVSVNYISGCYTPGQVMFLSLSEGEYTVTASKEGYETQVSTGLSVDGYSQLEILLSQ